MESRQLYRVKEEDLPRLEKLLTGCFEHDPLYCKLIPDEEIRKRLLPELFACDLTEFYETCEIYSDSPEMNSLLVVRNTRYANSRGYGQTFYREYGDAGSVD